MSDQDQLTPQERELERTLRSLRPASSRFDLVMAAAAVGDKRRRTLRMRRFAAAAVLAGVAVAIVLATSSPWRPDSNGEPPPNSAVAAETPVEPPTELVYRRALMRSSAEFDALLDEHAGMARDRDVDDPRIGVVMFWRSDRQPSSGAL